MDNLVDPFPDTPEFLKYVGVGVAVKNFYNLKQGQSFHLYEADDYYKEHYYRVRQLDGKWEDADGDITPEKGYGLACWKKIHFTLTTNIKPVDPFKDTPEGLEYIGVGEALEDLNSLCAKGDKVHLYKNQKTGDRSYTVRLLDGKWLTEDKVPIVSKYGGCAAWYRHRFKLLTDLTPVDIPTLPTETPLLFSDKVLEEENLC